MFPRLPDYPALEIVERKGLGHPDTICDALAELSPAISVARTSIVSTKSRTTMWTRRCYAGAGLRRLGGGDVIAPIRIYRAGRAVGDLGGRTIPVEDIAIEGSRAWLRANMTRWTRSVTFA